MTRVRYSIWDRKGADETLRRMWAEGHHARAIANALGPDFNRNMIIGRAHRLLLPSRPSPIKGIIPLRPKKPRAERPSHVISAAEQKRRVEQSAAEQAKIEARRGEIAAKTAERIQASEREAAIVRQTRQIAPLTTSERGKCAFPLGDPKRPGFRFCGEPTAAGSSYCSRHHAVCWISATTKKPVEKESSR